MEKNKEAEKFAREILGSMDTIQPVEVDDFIFTRIQNRINSRHRAWEAQRTTFYRLSMALAVFVILNATAYYFSRKTDPGTRTDRSTGISAFAREYKMTSSSYNY